MRATRDDLRLTWARAACAMAADAQVVEELLGLVDGNWSVGDGFSLDQEMRWLLAIKAAAFELDGAAGRVAVESRRDASDRAQRALIRAGASRPDRGSKAETWARINGEGYGSDYLTRAAIMGFQWHHQQALLAPFRGPFHEHLANVYSTRDHAFAGVYLRWLVPDRWAEPTELKRIRDYSADFGEQQGLLRRHLHEVADDMARDIRVRAYASLRGVPDPVG